MKNIVFSLTAGLMLVLACVSMWGCGDLFREDGEKEFTGQYIKGNANVVGFIDDSLVIVYDFQYWNQDLADGTQITGTGKQRLRVFNYRVQEDGPRWADTLDNMTEEYNYVKGQLSDSVIWGGKDNKSFSFWKLGEEPVVKNVKVKKEGCSTDFGYMGVKALRTWLDGNIIALGENSLKAGDNDCQYAVLDTVAYTITYKRLDGDLKWIEKCDDVRALGYDVACLVFDKINLAVFVLLNDEISDSLSNSEFELSKYDDVNFMGDILNFGGFIGSYNNGRVNIFSSVDLVGLMFRNIGGESINY